MAQPDSGPVVFWRSVQVCCILGAALVAFGAWQMHAEHSWVKLTAAILSIVGMYFFQRFAGRQALGWHIDERGERQKIEAVNRGHVIYTPTSHSQRVVEESSERKQRRLRLLWSTPVFLALVLFALKSGAAHETEAALGSSFFAFLIGCIWVPTVVREILYLSGVQDMKGAAVRDTPPTHPGIGDVERQKVYGNVTLATEEEALDLLRTKGRR